MNNRSVKKYFGLILTFAMFLAIPVTLYIVNQPQEVRTNAAQVTTPRPPQLSPTPTPSQIPVR